MKFSRKINFRDIILLFVLFISGCASIAKLAIGRDGLQVPQIVAHLQPFLKDSKITVLGKIVIQNPTESSLGLDKIYLEITDEGGNSLGNFVFDWAQPNVVSKQELEAPVAINLDLSTLNKKSVSVFMRTGFTYKKFSLHIPIESKVAVLHLEALKDTIVRPLDVNISTKFRSAMFGNSVVDFVIGITNPLSINMVLEDGIIGIYTLEGKDIVKSKLDRVLFKGSQSGQIKGIIKIGNIWKELIRTESARNRPLKFRISGNLKIPDTAIYMPFKIESGLEVKLSIF